MDFRRGKPYILEGKPYTFRLILDILNLSLVSKKTPRKFLIMRAKLQKTNETNKFLK